MLSSIILEIAVKDDEKSKTDCLGLLKSNEQGSFVNGLSHELLTSFDKKDNRDVRE
jgi:hypothetical protein